MWRSLPRAHWSWASTSSCFMSPIGNWRLNRCLFEWREMSRHRHCRGTQINTHLRSHAFHSTASDLPPSVEGLRTRNQRKSRAGSGVDRPSNCPRSQIAKFRDGRWARCPHVKVAGRLFPGPRPAGLLRCIANRDVWVGQDTIRNNL